MNHNEEDISFYNFFSELSSMRAGNSLFEGQFFYSNDKSNTGLDSEYPNDSFRPAPLYTNMTDDSDSYFEEYHDSSPTEQRSDDNKRDPLLDASEVTSKTGTERKKRSLWKPEEDAQLLALIDKHGKNWRELSNYMHDRTSKQIRDRYMQILKPGLKKEKWTKEEDEIILSFYLEMGSKWSKIAPYVPGRSDNQIKNRFYQSISKNPLYQKKLSNNKKSSEKSSVSSECTKEVETTFDLSDLPTMNKRTSSSLDVGLSFTVLDIFPLLEGKMTASRESSSTDVNETLHSLLTWKGKLSNIIEKIDADIEKLNKKVKKE